MIPSQALYRLQTMDLAIAQKRIRLAEIDAILSKDETVANARKSLEAAETVAKPWQTRARDLDLEIKGVVQKIQTNDKNLYSGKVSNPKELQEMQDEIVALKRRQSQLEDELLDAMLHSEDSQVTVDAARKKLDEVQARWAGSQMDMLNEKQRLEAEVRDLEAKRKEAAAAIDKASLTTYEALRTKKRGQAVALLKGDSCSACAVSQTSNKVQQVRQDPALVYCDSCGRILTINP
jgi:predicted  nucleic acid-binding Zn-ribbon protein